MKPFLVLQFLLIAAYHSFAQEASGKLSDEKNNSIPFANVLLYDAIDSSLKATALSDMNGVFMLKTIQYYLDIQSIGDRGFGETTRIQNYLRN